MTSADAVRAAHSHRDKYGALILGHFASLLAMPNVTGDLPALEAIATELVARFQMKRADARAVQLDGVAPVVLGTLRAERPTRRIGIYVHYDGQPVDRTKWASDPFTPTLRRGSLEEGAEEIPFPGPGGAVDPDWRIYARGAADDKAPFAALLGAIEALAAARIDRRTDVVFLFEGQEESGSPNLARYLELLAPDLAADLWLICDGPVHPTGRPQVVFGVRGYCGFELTVFGPERELHSGHFGNWVPNPAHDLARLLASFKDGEGRVLIEGFDEATVAVTEADRTAMADLPSAEDRYREDLGFGAAEPGAGSHAESLMRNSFNLRGLRSAATGGGARNVIPDHAAASVDIRLAAGNEPAAVLDLVEAHMRRHGYLVLDRDPTPEERRSHRHVARLDRDTGYPGLRTPVDTAEADFVVGAAAATGRGDVVRLPTFGGSVPLHHFTEALDAPVVIAPMANYDNNQHGPNENLRVGNLWYGIELMSALLAGD